MTALEIRLIAYGLMALGLIGGASWATWTLTSHHYERVMDAAKVAQDQAIQEAQQRVIDAQKAQTAAIAQAETDHATRVQADADSRAAILGSVRSLEIALHLHPVPTSVGDPGKPAGTAPGPSGTAESRPGDAALAAATESLNLAIQSAISACQHDSAEVAGILELIPK